LHGIAASELAVLFTRVAVARAMLADAATSDQSAEALIVSGVADAAAASCFPNRAALVAFATRALADRVLLDGVRSRTSARSAPITRAATARRGR
jgi:hypothetical protein